MAKERERKPLRERVAERKEQEQKEKRGPRADAGAKDKKPDASEFERREQANLWWSRVGMLGTTLQAIGLLLVIVEAFLIWTTAGGWDRWQWLIVYCIIFGAGRVLKLVGDAQQSVRRR